MPADTSSLFANVNPADFDVRSLDDEIRVDGLCAQLLTAVRDRLAATGGYTPLEVGQLCQGADYFLRDFIIAECNENLFSIPVERVRQFAGHWYIVRTLEPAAEELAALLAGIAACYRILAESGHVSEAFAADIASSCSDLTYYRQRIDDFWAIEDDGFGRWRRECPLPDRMT